MEADKTLQAIFEQTALGIAQISLDGVWLRVNDRYCQMLGYSESELSTKRICDITHPEDIEEVLAGRRQLLEGAISSHSMEKRYIRKDGTVFWGRLNRSLVRDRDSLPKYFICVVEDVTERIQAERALRHSEQRLALAHSAAQLGVCEWDLRTNGFVHSKEYARLYGLADDHPPLTREELRKRIHPEDRERVQAHINEALERAQAWETEYRVVWPDGSVHWLLSKGAIFHDGSRRPLRTMGVVLDITERKRTEEALKQSEERFRLAVKATNDAIWDLDLGTGTVRWNETYATLYGRPSETMNSWQWWIDHIHSEDRERTVSGLRSAISGVELTWTCEYRFQRIDGSWAHIYDRAYIARDGSGKPWRVIGAMQDLTERKLALTRQKLESLGVLASGIAHDFNNLLGSVMAQAEMVEADLAAGLSPDQGIAGIKTVANRGAEIVRELMIYAGQEQAGLFEHVDLSMLTSQMLELLKVSISKHARLKIDLHKNLPAVIGHAPQIRQVLMNLIINASEAIGEKEGVIQVTTSVVPTGDHVRLEVSDNGCGMAEEAKAQIFDPFFTTKFAGRGLGLAVVQGIVRSHGGAINVVSAPGQGATFQVSLPCASMKALEVQNAVAYPRAEQPHVLTRTRATVLVVEDEEVLRRAVSKVLRIKGFSVMEAQDGSVAIELMRNHRDNIDVILLDVTLPGASSKEVFEEAMRICVNPKVVLTSAYDRRTVDSFFPGVRIAQFIRKPFQLDDLASTLRSALASTVTVASGAVH